MKSVSPAYDAALASPDGTFSSCWKITRLDGTVLTFTDSDADIVFNGLRYSSVSGFSASNVQTSAGFAVGNLQVQGLLIAPSITKDSVLAGVWEYALLELFRVNRNDLTMGSESITKGRLGNVVVGRNSFTAEFRDMSQPLQRNIG